MAAPTSLPSHLKSTSIQAPVPAAAVVEVISADELAMWDQLEMQATQALARATIKPTPTIATLPAIKPTQLYSVSSDPRAPILCYKYTVILREYHSHGASQIQRLYCRNMTSTPTRSSSTDGATASLPISAIVDLWDDWYV